MNTARRLSGLGRRRRRRWTLDQIQVADPEMTRQSIKGASIGNFMEWYDFGVYGYIATTIAQVFYPGDSVSSVHLIATFSTLAAAFVVRPLGGFIFGPLGDRIGRKRVLMITIVLMTIGTTGTGLLPTYSAIGIWAPILLVVGRVFQGLSTGGEYVGAMTYVVEQAPDRKRGMIVGFLPLGNLGGFIAAGLMVTALQAWLPNHDWLTWGWRVPLLLSAPLGIVAIFMRMRLEESPAFQASTAERRSGRRGAAGLPPDHRRAVEADADLRGPGLHVQCRRLHADRVPADLFEGLRPLRPYGRAGDDHRDVDHPGDPAGVRRCAVRPHRG